MSVAGSLLDASGRSVPSVADGHGRALATAGVRESEDAHGRDPLHGRVCRDARGNRVDNRPEITPRCQKFVDKSLPADMPRRVLFVLPEGASNI